MIVFGKPRRIEETRRAIASARLAASSRDRLGALLEAGELAQGLIDAAFAARGFDDSGELESLCGELVRAAADGLVHGRDSAIPMFRLLDRLSGLSLPSAIEVRVPEGFAFYAVDPRLYQAASVDGPDTQVIGLRSIGFTLGAVVASSLDSRHPLVTLRPVGHPFRRELTVGSSLESKLLEARGERVYAIVDEGPGLSGSSFLCVARWLERRGIDRSRIRFYPSHEGGPGAEASEGDRENWLSFPKRFASFDERLAPSGAVDLSAGNWRRHLEPDPTRWPPSNPFFERRKYLLRRDGRSWMSKFSGFGRYGEAALARARALGEAGISPRPGEIRDGFIHFEWISGARPARLEEPDERRAILDTAGDYLGLLLRRFAAGSGTRGASVDALLTMARTNLGLRFGNERATELTEPWLDLAKTIQDRARPVRTDNRLHSWEWIRSPDGRIWKTDALDHHCAHDLVGSQDIAWDLAGARVELGLEEEEYEDLLRRVFRDAPGRRPNATEEDFYLLCYLAFQIGWFSESAAMTASRHAEDSRRLSLRADEYASCFERKGLFGRKP